MDTPVTDPAEPPDTPGTDPADADGATGATGASAPPPAPEPAPTVSAWFGSLYRSSTDRVLGGVCGGLAERFAVPKVLVQAGFALTGLAGIGVPVYVLAWVLLPTDRGERVMGTGPGRDLLAVGAVVVAGLMLIAQIDDISYFPLLGRSLPWLIILAGLALLLRRPTVAPPVRPDAPPAPRPTAPFSVSEAPPLPPPPPPGYAGMPAPARPPAPRPLPTPLLPRQPRPRPVVGPATWCLALVALGVMGIVAAAEPTSIGPGTMAAVVMILFGLGLTVSAFRGRARGLILPAVAVGSALAMLTSLDVRADNVAREFHLRISDERSLPSDIEAAVGSSTLDLRGLELDGRRTVRIRQSAGTIRIVLPVGPTAYVSTTGGYGSTSIERPSVRSALYTPQLALDWVDNGLPRDGQALSAAELRQAADDELGGVGESVDRDGGTVTVDGTGDGSLFLDIEMGLGDVRIIDPHWTDVPDEIVTPAQMCTVAGGARGVVSPCDDVLAANRVALCFGQTVEVVDCREIPMDSIDMTRTAVCRSYDGELTSCDGLGISPVGLAGLSLPEVSDSVDPSDPSDPSDPGDPVGPGDPTVPLPGPEVTVPPVGPDPTVAPVAPTTATPTSAAPTAATSTTAPGGA